MKTLHRFTPTQFARTTRSLRPAREGFTLVELMVVIIVIALLVGILIPAINAVRRRAGTAAIATELNELDFALKNFKTTFGEYPPDFANTDRTEAQNEVSRFIAKAWPRCTRVPRDFDKAITLILPAQYNAGTALAFWLEGTRLSTGERIGFSADPTNPFDVDLSITNPADPLYGQQLSDANVCPSRMQKFFHFPTDRITGSVTTGWIFWPAFVGYGNSVFDSNFTDRQRVGYVYFRANNRSYANKRITTSGGYVGAMAGEGTTPPTVSWQSGTGYSVGDIVASPTKPGRWARCVVAGTSAASEPIWDTYALDNTNTILDGSVRWLDCSPWMNADSFQVRCCGFDGLWWKPLPDEATSNDTRWGSFLDARTDRNPENRDDMSNAWSDELDSHGP